VPDVLYVSTSEEKLQDRQVKDQDDVMTILLAIAKPYCIWQHDSYQVLLTPASSMQCGGYGYIEGCNRRQA
jgi:hypothetical protein